MRQIISLVGIAFVVAACASSTPTATVVATETSDSAVSTSATEPIETTTTPSPPSTNPAGLEGAAVRVLDGDSIMFDTGSDELEVRLVGINAPEGDECHGDDARRFLIDMASEATYLTLVGAAQQDQFGRTLGYLYLDGSNANLRLVSKGHAVAMSFEHPLRGEFLDAENSAFAASLGLWAADACGPISNTTHVSIIELESDPSGPDEENLNGEFVIISNRGDDTVEMARWVLRDESTQNRFTFPEAFMLNPGDDVRVMTGCGNDSAELLHWCAPGPIWNNGGDTAFLLNQDGAVVDHWRDLGD